MNHDCWNPLTAASPSIRLHRFPDAWASMCSINHWGRCHTIVFRRIARKFETEPARGSMVIYGDDKDITGARFQDPDLGRIRHLQSALNCYVLGRKL